MDKSYQFRCNLTYSYTGTNGTSYMPSETLPSDPRDYLCQAIMGATENYESYQSQAMFQIHKQTSSGTLTMESWIQREQPKEPQLNFTNNIDVDIVEPNQSSGNQMQSLSILKKLLHDVEPICMISA